MAVEAYQETEEQTQINLSVLLAVLTGPHLKRPMKPTDFYRPRSKIEQVPQFNTTKETLDYMKGRGRKVALNKIIKSVEDES